MLTAQVQYNLAHARSYFAEHLAVGDYYSLGQSVRGEWAGEGARRLGLAGGVQAEAFLRLCDNQHPATGHTLTQRLNTVRNDGDRAMANRRIFFDFTFSPPKSVSLAAFLTPDPRILDAHERAVRVALRELERFAAVRVRKDGARSARHSGNVITALFTHETSRALDPHLHTHAIVFNASWDPVEARWKALENQGLLEARTYARNVYYHALARELRTFGYGIRNQARGDFELAGIPEELCRRFSKRDAQIDQAYARLLEQRPELASADVHALRRHLATAERTRKPRDFSPAQLRALWDAQLSPQDREHLERKGPHPVPEPASIAEAVAWAEEHLFDRNSVVPEHRLWQEALARGRGGAFTVEELQAHTASRAYVRSGDKVTTETVLAREREILRLARAGARALGPLVREPGPLDARLDSEQGAALGQLLKSTDAVSVFRGGAGTGKSFVLQSLVEQVRASGRPVVVLAPQRQQVVDLERAGFPGPATVAACLTRGEVPEGAVMVVDEAGQIGGRQMLELLQLAARRHARVLLSGDTRQHGPVEASDALRAIERHAGVTTVSLHQIRRQDPARARDKAERERIQVYRRAVEAAARGDLLESFQLLEAQGAVTELPAHAQADQLATEYVRRVREGASVVVVSQTWNEVHRLNERIRAALKAAGLLGPGDVRVEALERADLTQAQKRDPRFHPETGRVLFNRRFRRVEAGATGTVAAFLPDSVLVETGGSLVAVPHRHLDRITVCRPRELLMAPGDQLHLKANRRLASGQTVVNGERVTVKAVSPGGIITLADGRVLGREFREFLPGYAVTSYGSQGKTVDHVLLSDSGSRAATNSQQWYVSISRGRCGIRIFTPNASELRRNITQSGDRSLAVDLAPPRLAAPTRWTRVKHRLRRLGQAAVRRLRALRFLQPRPRHPHHDPPDSRRLGV